MGSPIRIPRDHEVLVLTGAGISAESGIQTFRDAGGLWEQHRIQDVATPEGWHRDPQLVWRFYSERRKQERECQPNGAHQALAELERRLVPGSFTLVTQNVDSLHERAGQREVIHMHGELRKTRCERCDRPPFVDEALYMGPHLPRCGCGGRLRPHIVWFGEIPFEMERIHRAVESCDLFVVVGSSGVVWPAAGLVQQIRYRQRQGQEVQSLYVGLERPENAQAFDLCRLGPAGQVLPGLFQVQG